MLNRSCTCTYTAAYKVDVIQLACKRLLVLRQFPCIPLYAAATTTYGRTSYYLSAVQYIDVVNCPTEDGGDHKFIWP